MNDEATTGARRHPRTCLSLKVEYPDADAFLHDYTENISRGGTFVSSEREWQVGDSLRLTLSFPGLLKPIQLEGRVAWMRIGKEPGIGVEFVFDDGDESRRHLEVLVRAVERRERGTVARQVRVLVVEDNPIVCNLLQDGLSRLLSRPGAPPVTFVFSRAEDGARAVAHVENHPVDIVITDCYLPVLDGETFIRRCRELLGPELPIIAVSAGGSEAGEKALAAGADLFLSKPLRLINVFETLTGLLGLSPDR